MSGDTQANGKSADAPAPEWFSWPTERSAARSVGIYPEQLRRIIKKHKIQPVVAPDKTYRYPPEVWAQVLAVMKGPGIPEDDEDNEDDDSEPVPARSKQTGKKTGETELAAALRLSNEHTREMFKLTQSAQKECFVILKDANKDLIAELNSLRQTAREATEARENALNQRLERELAVEEQKRKDARWDTALATLTQAIQMLGAQAFETWQEWKKPKHVQASELLQNLAVRIAENVNLSPEERERLLKVMQEAVGAAASSSEKESSSAQAGDATGGSSAASGGAAPESSAQASSGSSSDTSPGDGPDTSKPCSDDTKASPAPGSDTSPGAASDASSSAGADASGTASSRDAGPDADREGTAPTAGTAPPADKPKAKPKGKRTKAERAKHG